MTTLGGLLALHLRAGDLLALSGPLGAGKSTLARACIRALLAAPDAEVPSPTFSLIQAYDTPRLAVAHADLYRLRDPQEAEELGLEEALAHGAVLVEWPERAAHLTDTQSRTRRARGGFLDITLTETADGGARIATLSAAGDGAPAGTTDWAARIARIREAMALIDAAGLLGARVHYLQGDASPRRYGRLLAGDGRTAILMDAPRQPDGPPLRDGLPYSRIAHLAEDVRPFVAVADTVRAAGFSAPVILAQDLDAGLLLVEDLGDRVFGAELTAGTTPQATLWSAATDVAAALARVPLPAHIGLADGSVHRIPPLDRGVLTIEIELLIDWAWPLLKGAPAPAEARATFADAWRGVLERLETLPQGLVLRDFHSPNLMWLPDRAGLARVGLLDLQDALAGPAAYDLVSLLQDARLDVPASLEAELLARYEADRRAHEPDFDVANFRFAYAALGAQRNTKILGIFARLARRDGKPAYLAHMPRIWGYLARDLAAPDLAAVKAWYDHHLPPAVRGPITETNTR